ncbi:ATP-NAD kinase domain-containing protein [Ditylenchus destructor]|uniref:NAD(+) kinase n=1 Tax=Ditylenchus destructor TaxID=166010 RepID=A0AAD4NIF0_9BILA|nr:ATP-NAD kinase domain-containing protein [Ditylenchus destructor]
MSAAKTQTIPGLHMTRLNNSTNDSSSWLNDSVAMENGYSDKSNRRLKDHPAAPFKPTKVVIVSKSSMLEYELARLHSRTKKHYSGIDDKRFVSELIKRHANIEELKRRHAQQADYIKSICDELDNHNIEYKVVNRHNYTTELVHWSDLVISAGGDGTFLTAAKKVRNGVPVIGINTDPIGSEGHLCLTGKARRPAGEVLRQFLNNEFRWAYRQRIRVNVVKPSDSTLASPSASSSSSSADEEPETVRNGPAKEFKFSSDDEYSDADVNIEPRLALNEVFMGESHAARVSYYDVQIDDGPLMKQKSSGMTVCTGTGSTSWHYNINRLTEQNLKEVLDVMNRMSINIDREMDDNILEEICRRYNDQLVFEPEAQKMAFSIRDPVFNATFPKTASRGFATRIRLKSRCTHAHLILDGSTSIPFNRGAEVILEMYPEDALRTVHLT